MVELFLCKPQPHQQDKPIPQSSKPLIPARGRNKRKIRCIIDIPIDHVKHVPSSEKTFSYLRSYGLLTVEDLYRATANSIECIEDKTLRNALLSAWNIMHKVKYVHKNEKYIFDYLYPRKRRKIDQAIKLGIKVFEDVLKSKNEALKVLKSKHPELFKKEPEEKKKKQALVRYMRKNIDRIPIAV